MEVAKGSAGIGRLLMAIRSYSGDYEKANPGVVSLTLSLRAVKSESKEERKTRRDTFTG